MNKEPASAFIFPGQGAQYSNMGKDFVDNFSEARDVFEEAEEILQKNIRKMIFSNQEDLLTQTENSQVAIFVTSMAMLKTLEKQLPDLSPSITAGLSLGEYSALVAAKKLSFASCVSLVQKRATFMQRAAEKNPGTMFAAMGVSETDLVEDRFWIANLNCPGQVVVACSDDDKDFVKKALLDQGCKKVIPLKVSGAFHTPLMQEAGDSLAPYIQEAPIITSSCDFVMNVSAKITSLPEEIKQNLILQVSNPTRWLDCVKTIDKENPACFLEIGPQQLHAMHRKIGVSTPYLSLSKVQDLDTLHEQGNFYETTKQ